MGADSARKLARVGVLAHPAARLGTPKRSPVSEHGDHKSPRSVGQGHVDTVIAEADDIGVAVVVDVRKQARVAVLAAPAGGRTKGVSTNWGAPKFVGMLTFLAMRQGYATAQKSDCD